jgi:hypothetical protein
MAMVFTLANTLKEWLDTKTADHVQARLQAEEAFALAKEEVGDRWLVGHG